MEQTSQDKKNEHFPEDRDAPYIKEQTTFLKNFYRKFHTQIDYFVLALISLSTLVTVSLSLYIMFVKYF
ncbi:MAG: hypothetical protein ABI462_09285 [Ignavibacteria bacterium]